MADAKAKTGMVGFFDILGYQNVIANNAIEQTANIVLSIINKMPEISKSDILKTIAPWPTPMRERCSQLVEKIEWIVFSDTIFSAIDLDGCVDDPDKELAISMFLASCCTLQRQAFDAGLPLRGAIASGKYYSEKQCFVGTPIVEAYQYSQKQDWSGAALAPSASIICGGPQSYNYEALLASYLVPIKNSAGERLLCLRWGGVGQRLAPPVMGVLREYVLSKFLAHSKDVPIDVMSKVGNTEVYLQFLRDDYERRASKDTLVMPPKTGT